MVSRRRKGDFMLRKTSAIAYSLLVVGWFFISQHMAGLLGKLLYTLGMRNLVEHNFLLTLISYGICIGGLVVIEQQELCFTKEQYQSCNTKKVGRYMIYGIGLWILTSVINNMFIPFFPNYDNQINGLFDGSEPILRFIVLVIGAPLIEEFIFRGKIQNYLKDAFGHHGSIIIQGLIFGLIHQFGLQKIYASILGIGFGYVKDKENNLWASTVMHMTINGLGWMIGIIAYYRQMM